MFSYLIMYLRDWALSKIMRSIIRHYSPKLVCEYESVAKFRKFYFEVMSDRYYECYHIFNANGYSWFGERYRQLARSIYLEEMRKGGKHFDD